MAWAAVLSMYRPPDFDWKKSFQFSLLRQEHTDMTKIYPPCVGQSWESLDVEKLKKRHIHTFQHVILMDVGHPSLLLGQLGEYLGMKVHQVAPMAEEIASNVQHGAQRILFSAQGASAQELFVLLHKHPGMRDVLFGVLILDPIWEEDWMNKYFGQDEMDTEANSPIPYVFCFTKEECDVPEPKESATGWQSIRKIQVGLVSSEPIENMAPALASLFSALHS